MKNEEIIIKKQKEFNLNWGELSTYRALMELARQDERETVLKAFADWLDGEGFPVPDRKLQEYIKYNL